jgi:hypothetical protein
MIVIEVGGGHVSTRGAVNLDPVHGAGPWRRRAQDTPWPTGDGTVEAVRASHVLEHIPAGEDRIAVFNEVHRVLSPKGAFHVVVPLMTGTWHAIADPTHVSFWVRESFGYFDGSVAPNADYGILPWKTSSFHVVGGWEGHWTGMPMKSEAQ